RYGCMLISSSQVRLVFKARQDRRTPRRKAAGLCRARPFKDPRKVELVGHERRARVSRAPTTSLGGRALGVEGHYLLGYLFYVLHAEKDYFYGGCQIVVAADYAGGQDHDVAGAVGTLAVLDADDICGHE